jgi:outer membrane autotransporter protein
MSCTFRLGNCCVAPRVAQFVCALVACTVLGTIAARAQDATWTGSASSDWNTGANWTSALPPTGTAAFSNSGIARAITFSSPTTVVGAMQFDSAASSYAFTIFRISPPIPALDATLIINGAGIRTESGSPVFNVTGSNVTSFNRGSLLFQNSSAAGSAAINSQLGFVQFSGNSSAQNANINSDTANLWFKNSSTAGNATIRNAGPNFNDTTNGITFFDTSTAGNATIRNVQASTFFRNSSSAGAAAIEGRMEFFDVTSAANATLVGFVNFWDHSTAGSATITATSGGVATFFGNSTGGHARVIAEAGGVVDFNPGTGPNNDRKISVGSIEGAGLFQLGANQLTVGSNNLSTTVIGVISDCCAAGGSLVKVGTGTLTLAGVNTYVGATTVREGTLLVNGATTSATTIENGAILGGTGTIAGNITNSGILAPGSVTSVGTLTIGGNLTQNPASTLLINATPTQASRVLVTGTATLAGAVSVNAGSGAYAPDTRYTILTANGGLIGEFSAVTSNLAFLMPGLSYGANDAFLTFSCITCGPGSTGYTSVAQTGNQLAVANALNHIVDSGSASTSMQTAFTNLNNLTANQARPALDSIGGASLKTTSNAQFGLMSGFNNVIAGRLDSRGDGPNVSTAGFTTGAVRLAARDLLSDAQPIYAQTNVRPESTGVSPSDDGRRGAWIRVYGTNNDTSGDGNASGFRVRGSGFTVGLDGEPVRNLQVGVAVGTGKQELSTDGSGDSSDVDGVGVGLYAQLLADPWTLKVIGSYARNDNHSARNVVVGTNASFASADYDSNAQSVYAEASYRIARGTFEVHPLAALSYVRLDNPGYVETGAGALNLAVASQTRTSARSYLGAKTVHSFDTGNGIVRVEPRLLWSHEFGDVDTAPISVLITGGGAAGGFQVQGPAVKRDGAVLGLGLSGN